VKAASKCAFHMIKVGYRRGVAIIWLLVRGGGGCFGILKSGVCGMEGNFYREGSSYECGGDDVFATVVCMAVNHVSFH
jgi:hypothetical protein